MQTVIKHKVSIFPYILNTQKLVTLFGNDNHDEATLA